MDVVSTGPLRTASLLWQGRPGAWVLTVVCKATFHLRPDESTLADEQDAPNEEDNYWNDDRSRSVYSISDLAPFKRRADVLLVGSAFAPRKDPVKSLVARLMVADIDKSIEVFGERTRTREGELRKSLAFAKMPIRYERAAGGPETTNPVGMRLDGQADPQGAIPLPNLQPIDLSTPTGSSIPPIGFGPLAPTWPERRAMLGRHAGSWPQATWTDHPLPDGISPEYFNAAPADQRLDALRETELLILENLHPEHPRLITALPGVKPKAVIERSGVAPEELRMTPDTLWIDTDRSLCTLTWRGQVQLKHRAEAGRVVISVDRSSSSHPAVSESSPSQGAGDPTQTLSFSRALLRPAMPFLEGAPDDNPLARFNPAILNAPLASTGTVALPSSGQTMKLGGETPTAIGESEADAEVISVRDISPDDEQEGGGAWQQEAWQSTAAPVPPAIAAPAMVRPQVTSDPLAPPAPKSPWSVADARPPGLSLDAPQATLAAVAPALMTPSGASPKAAIAGVKAASDAAARADAMRQADPSELATIPPPPLPEARPKPRDVIKLVWFDPKSLPRVRKHPRFRVLLAELELRLLDEGEDDAEDDAEGSNNKDRRDIFEVLARGGAIGVDAVKQAFAAATTEDGKFDPPLVLVAGELEFPFDELETLKATATAVSPLASGDKRLKETLDTVNELLKTPWLQSSGGVAERLTAQIKEAFAQGKRVLPPNYLEEHTERMLLEQRCYQKRTVFGKRWIRSTLKGASGAAGETPVYVPEALKDELPMFRRVRVKLIGEVDMQEDQYEASDCAIKVVAFGRVMRP